MTRVILLATFVLVLCGCAESEFEKQRRRWEEQTLHAQMGWYCAEAAAAKAKELAVEATKQRDEAQACALKFGEAAKELARQRDQLFVEVKRLQSERLQSMEIKVEEPGRGSGSWSGRFENPKTAMVPVSKETNPKCYLMVTVTMNTNPPPQIIK